MKGFLFQEIEEKHLDGLLAIYNYYVLYTTATFHLIPIEKKEFRKLVFFDKSKYKTYVISIEENLCGYIILSPFKNREAYDRTAEVTIYLDDKYSGKGIGTLALKFIEEYAKNNNIHVLIATISSENAKSIKMFAKNGFLKCAHYKNVGEKFGRVLDVVGYQKIL